MSDEEKKLEVSDNPEKKDLAENIPAEVQEVLKGAPPEVQKIMRAMMFSATGPMPPPVHPLFNKFTDAHVDKFLDYAHEDDKNNFTLEKSSRVYSLLYICLGIGFLIFLVIYLAKDNKELLSTILQILVAFGGGFGTGFGAKSYIDKKKR